MKSETDGIKSKIIASMVNIGVPVTISDISKDIGESSQLVRYHVEILISDAVIFNVFKRGPGKYYVLHDMFYDESLFEGVARGLLPITTAIRESINTSRPNINIEDATLNVLQNLVILFLSKIKQDLDNITPENGIITRIKDPEVGEIEFVENDIHNCPVCGLEIKCRKYILEGVDEYYDKVYCSKRCYRKDETEEFDPFRGGISVEEYCKKFNPEFKSRVRAFFGFRCLICGKSEEDEGRKMAVHHVNYEKSSCCDKDIKPLFATLCMKHHALTNHNRDYWNSELEKIINEKYGGKCYFTKLEMSENKFPTPQ